MNSAIYEGWIRHRRLEPVANAFRYRAFLMYLDLGELPTLFERRRLWSVEGRTPATFRRADYGGDPAVPLDREIRDLVHERIGRRPAGPIRLLTHLRYFGYCFNPVSFYYCWDGEDLDAIVAEITNTPWGERHSYVLDARSAGVVAPERTNGRAGGTDPMRIPGTVPDPVPGPLSGPVPGTVLRFRFPKQFHVSPFFGMDQEYVWAFTLPGERLAVHMDNREGGRKLFDATMSMRRRAIDGKSLARVLATYPFMTAKVIAAIHWQALRLWIKRCPRFPHPKDRDGGRATGAGTNDGTNAGTNASTGAGAGNR